MGPTVDDTTLVRATRVPSPLGGVTSTVAEDRAAEGGTEVGR